jgi:hypothetical protein
VGADGWGLGSLEAERRERERERVISALGFLLGCG